MNGRRRDIVMRNSGKVDNDFKDASVYDPKRREAT